LFKDSASNFLSYFALNNDDYMRKTGKSGLIVCLEDLKSESRTPIIVNFLVSDVPRCVSQKEDTWNATQQFPGMAASSDPPHGARTFYHRTDESLVK
jgi:hypothetical protein